MNWIELKTEDNAFINFDVQENEEYIFCDEYGYVFIDTVHYIDEAWYLDSHNIDEIVAYAELTPFDKDAHWINHSPSGKEITKQWTCSKCNGLTEIAHYSKYCYYKFCPNCGEKLNYSSDRT